MALKLIYFAFSPHAISKPKAPDPSALQSLNKQYQSILADWPIMRSLTLNEYKHP